MSRQTLIFVATDPQDADLVDVLEQELRQPLRHEEGSDPYIRINAVAAYVGAHEFDDDDITWEDGSDVMLHSTYPTLIEVRDTDGDYHHQVEIGDRVFTALKSRGHWPAVYIDDMQKIVDSFSPGE